MKAEIQANSCYFKLLACHWLAQVQLASSLEPSPSPPHSAPIAYQRPQRPTLDGDREGITSEGGKEGKLSPLCFFWSAISFRGEQKEKARGRFYSSEVDRGCVREQPASGSSTVNLVSEWVRSREDARGEEWKLANLPLHLPWEPAQEDLHKADAGT